MVLRKLFNFSNCRTIENLYDQKILEYLIKYDFFRIIDYFRVAKNY